MFSPSRSSSEEIRPRFFLSLPPEEGGCDKSLFTKENCNNRKDEAALASRYVSSVETDNRMLDAKRGMKSSESRSIPRHEQEDNVALISQSNRKRSVSNSSPQAADVVEEGILCQLSESETNNTGRLRLPPSVQPTRLLKHWDMHVPKLMREQDRQGGEHLENIGADRGQMLDMKQVGRYEDTQKEIGQRDVKWPNENRADEMGQSSKAKLDSVSTTNDMDKSFHTEGAKPWQKEENEYRVMSAAEINEAECSSENNSPAMISVSVVKQPTSGLLAHCESTSVLLGEFTADYQERTSGEHIDNMEVGMERESTEDKVDTEQHHCSDVQLTDTRCDTDCRDVNELLVKGTEDNKGDEFMMTAVDTEDKSTGAYMSGLICLDFFNLRIKHLQFHICIVNYCQHF